MAASPSYVLTDSYGSGFQGVVGIGVTFRRGRVICGEIAEAPDLLAGELLSILRAVEISSKCRRTETVIGTDHELAAAMVSDPIRVPRSPIAAEIQRLLKAHPYVTVEHAPFEVIKPARLLARQIFKAWKCSFESGVTWTPGATSELAEAVAA